MNTAKYNSPRKIDRPEISLEKFCRDCEKDRKTCGRDVNECIEEAVIYKEFAIIKK
jgi:hypothetical protein